MSEYDFLVQSGCEDVSASLGIRQMPDGYHLMLNSDRDAFFAHRKNDGWETATHWDKWAVYHWAKQEVADSALMNEHTKR